MKAKNGSGMFGKTGTCLVLFVVIGLLSVPSRASIIYVNASAKGANNGSSWQNAFRDLQSALSAAQSGNEIWVSAGTYKPGVGVDSDAAFQLKNGVGVYGGFAGAETRREERNWQTNRTVLSGDRNGDDWLDAYGYLRYDVRSDNSTHVFFHPKGTNLNASAVLDGFTITGGNAVVGSSPQGDGAGMYNDESSPTVANCIFRDNHAKRSGAGMFNRGSSPTLINCTFVENYGDPSDLNGGWGGGMCNIGGSPVLTGCVFTNNGAGYGGGMYNLGRSSPMVTNCRFEGNYGKWGGGGIRNEDGSPVVINCVFTGNKGYLMGGGGICNINIAGGSLIVTNCTFSRNDATPEGGGLCGEATVTNCIFWGNSATQKGSQISACSHVTCSNVEGGYPGTSNVNVDPLFVDPAAGDLSLKPRSPCIDVGNNFALPKGITTDIAGGPRIWHGVVDLGAYEWVGEPGTSILHVSNKGYDAADGLSWATAKRTLQAALDRAVFGDEIWVARGTYKPTVGVGGSNPQDKAFQLKNGVPVYGGFAGTETSHDQRDWRANKTILSGDLIGNDNDNVASDEPTTYQDNCHHIFYHTDGRCLDELSVLDGFTITGGSGGWEDGAGIYNGLGSSPTVANCTFTSNAASNGGAMCNSHCAPTEFRII